MTHVPTFAVVGVPNAGKSTLINRLTGTRVAVVHETPGVTRDRKVIETEWTGHPLKLIDTGGFDTSDQSLLAGDIRSQVKAALDEADGAVFVVDGRAGPLSGDHEIADVLRRAKIPTLLVANKVDDPRHEADLVAFFELGLGEPLAVSALHGTGSGDLLDELVALAGRLAAAEGEAGGEADEDGQADEHDDTIPVAIVGRPNAGKSSLLNALAGEERVIVSEVAGTTRDAIDTMVTWRGHDFRFVDTAGMRKAAKISGVEYYAYLRSLASLDRAHVAIIVVDATVGLGELDLQIGGEATRRECATVLAVNKSDLTNPDLVDLDDMVAHKLRQRPQALAVSAHTGRGLEHLLQVVADLQTRYTAHIPTGALNRALTAVTEQRAMPGKGRKKLKVYYISQYQTAPPRFAISINDRDLVTRDFGFFVENRLRAALDFAGVPLIIDFKER
jgi:GTP-binding protein